MSTPFRVDIEDLEFVFFDQLGVPELLGDSAKYGELDRETYRATLAEAAKLAVDVLHPIDGPGDRQGCTLDDDGNVTTPAGYIDAWNKMAEGGWIAPSAPVEYGGVGMPAVLSMAVNNMFNAACMAFMMYPGLSAAAARMVVAFGSDDYKALVAEKLFTGQWGGTMCLTESGAGSSVGDNRAKAVPSGEPGVYHLEGEKIFISGGDHDLADNIIHLVLARTPDSPHGTKGLSLFLVPKFEFDAEGNLGARNGAKVVGIEHKMGINGSATCVLALGADKPCKGWLIGKERDGISQMFQMMNEARIGVAGQGAGTAAAAYGYAVEYARERQQGTSLTKRDSDVGRVNIVEHPDVRRMLMTLKVHAETTRSAVLKIALDHDRTDIGAPDREKIEQRMDLLIPVLKAHCTDVAFDMASMAVQVYGGYGFIKEYPVEQVLRDSKIQAIYEGTNGIQALDLLGRKMRINNGALFMGWLSETQATLTKAGGEGFADQAQAIGKVVAQLGACAMHLGKTAGGGDVDGAFVHAVPFLRAFGVVLLAMEALEQARVAKTLIEERGASPHLRGKLLNLDFYVNHILPHGIAYAKTVQSGDRSCLDEVLFGA